MDLIIDFLKIPQVFWGSIALFIWYCIGWVFMFIGCKRQGAPKELSEFIRIILWDMGLLWPFFWKDSLEYHRWEK